ncbi:hypothetical protein BDP27DRAFT_1364523 [Rhodocollybia butyracea]|uniref:Uncharacterized protein n=1 Tax=Rhodocollybia butyracea TaxID=206335 RepID=A0A9P5PTI2_9AGAR|nr:hypothetical protein BDP27DRAFT_1364523 [Rhodocollybia butyracea]
MAPKSSAQKRQTKKTSQPATATTNTTASSSGNKRTRANSGAETSAKEHASKRGRKESTKDTAAEDPQPDQSAKNTRTSVANSDITDDVTNVDELSPHDIDDGDVRRSSIFSGKFDIYVVELPFLSSVYLPKGTSQPQYENLYKTILKYQAKPDFTAQCAIPDLSRQTSGSGSLSSVCFADPFSDEPYDIAIENVESVDKVSYTAIQQGKFIGTPTTGIPGVLGNLSLRDSGCGIQSSKGEFRMTRVWTKNDNGKLSELFEGILSLRVNYGSLYQRKGHGTGMAVSVAFWAVRARKDAAGKEIGLDCGEESSFGHWVDYGNESFQMRNSYGGGYDSDDGGDGDGDSDDDSNDSEDYHYKHRGY